MPHKSCWLVGTDVNGTDNVKCTALVYACCHEHVLTAKLVLEHGARVNLEDCFQRSHCRQRPNVVDATLMSSKTPNVNLSIGLCHHQTQHACRPTIVAISGGSEYRWCPYATLKGNFLLRFGFD